MVFSNLVLVQYWYTHIFNKFIYFYFYTIEGSQDFTFVFRTIYCIISLPRFSIFILSVSCPHYSENTFLKHKSYYIIGLVNVIAKLIQKIIYSGILFHTMLISSLAFLLYYLSIKHLLSFVSQVAFFSFFMVTNFFLSLKRIPSMSSQTFRHVVLLCNARIEPRASHIWVKLSVLGLLILKMTNFIPSVCPHWSPFLIFFLFPIILSILPFLILFIYFLFLILPFLPFFIPPTFFPPSLSSILFALFPPFLPSILFPLFSPFSLPASDWTQGLTYASQICYCSTIYILSPIAFS